MGENFLSVSRRVTCMNQAMAIQYAQSTRALIHLQIFCGHFPFFYNESNINFSFIANWTFYASTYRTSVVSFLVFSSSYAYKDEILTSASSILSYIW